MTTLDGGSTIEPGASDGDRQAEYLRAVQELTGFVTVLRELLEAVVVDGRFLPERERERVRAAWPDARGGLNELLDLLSAKSTLSQGDDSSPSYGELPKDGYATLRDAGFVGPSRTMKMDGFRSRLFAFGKRMNRGWLGRVLGWSGPILDSISEWLGIKTPINEFLALVTQVVSEKLQD